MLINEQIHATDIPNPLPHLPSVRTDELIKVMRVDKTLGDERIGFAILTAYKTVRGELCHHHLQADFVPDKEWQDDYCLAVMCEAAAFLCENHADFDTIGQGLARTDNDKSDSLRRMASHAIADMTGKTRNRFRLL